jgi:Icc protein
LVAVIQAVAAWRADAVMLTGDLSEDASESSYQRLADYIHTLDIPVCAIPGNHDLPEVMQSYFPHGPYQGPYLQAAGAWKLLLLNSARPRRVDGSIAAVDLQHLAEWLKAESTGPALLALHHQPVPVGAPWIDKHMLDQPQNLLQCVADHPQVKAVVWGHVHQPFETALGGVRFMSAPSSAANSLPGTERFSLDPSGPACRWLELFDDGRLDSGILHANSD